MNVLDLFSGIGGFSLGLERAGMRTVAFCEIDPYCQRVLGKHWPDVPVFGDIRELTVKALAHALRLRKLQSQGGFTNERRWTENGGIEVICGGFPCQDISIAGKGAGIEGSRSGLWSEYARIIREVRPRYAIIENVAILASRGLQRVLWDLWQAGYDAEWMCIRACDVGAPHIRDRIWIVAYPSSAEWREVGSACERLEEQERIPQRQEGPSRSGASCETGNANGSRLSPSWPQPIGAYWRQAGGMFAAADWWRIEPNVGRVAYGVPARVDRLRSLGNAIVPQIAEIIGRAILANEAATQERHIGKNRHVTHCNDYNRYIEQLGRKP